MQGPIIRTAAAALGWCGAMIISAKGTLANATARQMWRGDIVFGLRLILWLLRRGRRARWVGLGDNAFDFTEHLSPAELLAATRFLERQRSRLSKRIYAGDMLFIAARRFASDPQHEIAFRAAANSLLQDMPKISDVAPGESLAAKPQLTHADAKAALNDCAALMAGLNWFVLSGTFLGLIRENGFLQHDYDIDIGVFDDTPLDDLKARIAGNSTFALRKIDVQPAFGDLDQPRPMLVKLVHRTGVPLDVFYHYKSTDGRVVHGSSLHHWFNSPFDLQDYSLEGVAVRGPTDADRYLTENYGHWRTPVVDFNCSTDTPNLSIVRHPIAVAIFLRRLARFAELGDPNLSKLVSELLREELVTEQAGSFVLGPVFRD